MLGASHFLFHLEGDVSGQNRGGKMTERKDTAEKRLWNAVLLLAAQDAKAGSAVLRQALNEWIDSPDFEWVCENADQDALSTRRGLLQLLTTYADKTKPKPKPKPKPECAARGSNAHAHALGRSARRTRKRGLAGHNNGKKRFEVLPLR